MCRLEVSIGNFACKLSCLQKLTSWIGQETAYRFCTHLVLTNIRAECTCYDGLASSEGVLVVVATSEQHFQDN